MKRASVRGMQQLYGSRGRHAAAFGSLEPLPQPPSPSPAPLAALLRHRRLPAARWPGCVYTGSGAGRPRRCRPGLRAIEKKGAEGWGWGAGV